MIRRGELLENEIVVQGGDWFFSQTDLSHTILSWHGDMVNKCIKKEVMYLTSHVNSHLQYSSFYIHWHRSLSVFPENKVILSGKWINICLSFCPSSLVKWFCKPLKHTGQTENLWVGMVSGDQCRRHSMDILCFCVRVWWVGQINRAAWSMKEIK